MLCFNFFFLPPVGTFTIADPQNWVALFAFLAVSLVASNLSAVARARTQEAVGRRDELARLFDLSRDVLMMTDSREALADAGASRSPAGSISSSSPSRCRERRLGHLRSRAADDRRSTRASSPRAFAAAQASLEFDALRAHLRRPPHDRRRWPDRSARAAARRHQADRPARGGRAAGRAGTLDALAGVVAIAIERAQFLEERKAAELTRQSEELKTALLASLGHDLRTPLTAIRVAASNMKAPGWRAEQRVEQSDLILPKSSG